MTEEYRNTLPLGHRLHEYRIEKILGAGGFGVTYLAYDEHLQQRVAIKEYMPNDLAVREGTTVHAKSSGAEGDFRWGLDRFVQEARTLARFHHPNIVQVLRFFEANNTAYVVMVYEDGDSLENILARRRTPLDEEALRLILLPLLDGLEEVHGAGLIHRDIKPGNIYIRRKDESPVLLDFGAARQAIGAKSKSLSVIVSDGYAPAEQYETHGNQGPWTDLYALSAVMYRAISGEVPIQATARIMAVAKRQADPLRSAREVGQGRYSKEFLEALDRTLSVIETDRPQSVAEWRGLLKGKSAQRKLTDHQDPVNNKDDTTRVSRKLLGILCVVIFSIWGLSLIGRESTREQAGFQASSSPVQSARRAPDSVSGPEFIRVPGGTFEMGCGSWQSGCSDNEKPVHRVTVGTFEIGKYEVTQRQWREVMGSDPPELHFKGCDDCPVENVSWNDAQEFLKKLNGQGGGKYRLPTEAEWEYACRSGGKAEKYCGGNNVEQVAWYDGNSGNKTHPVGQKAANGLGIHDMSGNVWEWVSDWYGDKYYANSPQDNPQGPSGGSDRVVRGGSWNYDPAIVRSAFRYSFVPGFRGSDLGLRLSRTNP